MKSHPTHGRPARQNLAPRHHAARRNAGAPGRHGRNHQPIGEALAPRACRMSRRTLALAELKLAQMEDAFLDTLLDAHPRRNAGLDRLLGDLAGTDPSAVLPKADEAVAGASSRRIESALLAAVVKHHPRRERALDRLLCDLAISPASTDGDSASAPEAAHGAWVGEEERRQAEFDVCCDNDFDGLG